MAGKSVAIEGEVTATASSSKLQADTNQTGAWSAGSVTETAYDKLAVGGTAVIYQAQCTFTYSGGTATAGTATVSVPPVSDVVTLMAQSTILQSGSNKVLLDGDKMESPFGNKLEVSAAGKLTSS